MHESEAKRKRKQCAKAKAIELHKKEGKTAAEISAIIKYSPEQIHDWLIQNRGRYNEKISFLSNSIAGNLKRICKLAHRWQWI
ncbi:hypothetical protein OH784_28945 [Ectobacillus funiculus]|uniref:hypothetical protein n=1 Tax=Ectobacillus funiculus TaxID=137993 RepID=UPI003979C322